MNQNTIVINNNQHVSILIGKTLRPRRCGAVFVTVKSALCGNVDERGLEWTEGGGAEERTALSEISAFVHRVCVGAGLHNTTSILHYCNSYIQHTSIPFKLADREVYRSFYKHSKQQAQIV